MEHKKPIKVLIPVRPIVKPVLFLENGDLNPRAIPKEYFLDELNVAIIPDFISKYATNLSFTADDI